MKNLTSKYAGAVALLAWALMMDFSARAVGPAASTVAPPAPPLPTFRALKLEPAQLTLSDGRDERRVLVWGETSDGRWLDLTAQATLAPASTNLLVDAVGYVRGTAKGTGEIKISAAGLEARLPVVVASADLPPVRFVRDVEPILSKAGCNQGTCHGSAKGKNGFKLSLRGYDSEYDYQALVNDLSGRRFNRAAVDESLMLLKPTGDVPHEGRQALKPGSREHQLVRAWIAEGAPYEEPSAGRANQLQVLPNDIEMDLPGRQAQILVVARFADGSSRDVTREAVFASNNGDVATVKDGLVTGIRRGEAAILIRYEGLYTATRVTVMGDRSGFQWSTPPENNFLDGKVNQKLQKMKILPSDLCSDADFLRRVSLDLTGLPPKSERVRAFLADPTPSREKREKLIDELIGSKDFVEFWANKWADLLQCNSEKLGQRGVWHYRNWIREQIAQNTPYDQFVRAIVTAQGSSYESPAVNYLRVLREPGKMTEDVSQTFLGVRFNCNKCHDHPFEKWTQNQYYEMSAYFAQLGLKPGKLDRQVIFQEAGGTAQITAEEILYTSYRGGEMQHLRTGKDVAPKVPFGAALVNDGDRRQAFADWLVARDNPFFAKSFVNRVWSYFFGIGIIDPVDDIRAGNPPSNAALLDALTADFIKHNFDVRYLMRTIVRSRTYQLSFAANPWNADDKINFSHARPRRLSAEQMLDAVDIATGVRPKFAGVPVGMRAVEIPDGMVVGNDFLTLFGRPKRQSACECERSSNISLSHALNMINGVTLSDAINAPNNKIARLAAENTDGHKLVEEVYLTCLDRLPTAQEFAAVDVSQTSTPTGRLELAQDLAWALINSPAFIFNR